MATTAGLLGGSTNAVSRPRRRDLRKLIGVLIILVGVVATLADKTQNQETQAVLVAARDIPVGATLRMEDLVEARVRLDPALSAAAVPASEAAQLVGWTVRTPLYGQQVLVRAQLVAGPVLGQDQVAMTVAIRAEAAAGGKLRPGDQVQVLVTTDKGKPTSQSSLVLERVTVYAVGYEDRMAAVGSAGRGDGVAPVEQRAGPLTSVTLVLAPDDALKLARAKHNGDLDIVLLPPDAARRDGRG